MNAPHPDGLPAAGDRAHRPILFLILLCAFAAPFAEGIAQPRFQLQRTKRETMPISVQLYGGYNGISDPSDRLQDLYENTSLTSWGGVMIGLKVRAAIDTVVRPVWAGIDLYYHRTAKRWLYDKPSVVYASDSSRVHADERLASYGFHLFGSFELFPAVCIELGGGFQYLHASNDIESPLLGLFEPVWVGTGMAGVDIALLRYEHGSINGNFRLVKGFGEYGSVHFQSLLAFTFSF